LFLELDRVPDLHGAYGRGVDSILGFFNTLMLLVSDFNLLNLLPFLARHKDELGDQHVTAPFGQVTQVLLDEQSPLWQPRPQACFVWTQPQAVLPHFQRLLDGFRVNQEDLNRDVDAFAGAVRAAAARVPMMLVASWCLSPKHSGHGLLDLQPGNGAVRLLMQANLRLFSAFDDLPSVFCLNADRWMHLGGPDADSPRLWYGAKVPFNNEVFKVAAADIASAVRGIRGRTRKLVLLDLDDTLWGGIVGDIGWRDLVLGGHDPTGEAFVDFQRELKAMSRRGIALGILSKNQEQVALEAIRSHPEMVLGVEDFAGWRINWQDKAENLAELVRELNLGRDSVVFIDDNPAERARVREAYPEVLVPDWPADKRLYRQALLTLDCFDSPGLTEEDRHRVIGYSQERRRVESRDAALSVEEWLAKLELSVDVRRFTREDLGRLTQLLNKTNQMNLTTRRLSEPEVQTWASGGQRELWAVRVSDRFGDYGLTGILSTFVEGLAATILDFVLSCRVMGRRVEETMLHLAVEWAREKGLDRVRAKYVPTEKNLPVLEFFRRSGWTADDTGVFSWNAAQAYPLSSFVRLVVDDSESRQPSSLRPSH
jgi:FkbH-like protein